MSIDLDGIEDELPDDVEDDEKYISIPDKRELDLGKPMVLDFAHEFLPGGRRSAGRVAPAPGGRNQLQPEVSSSRRS